MKFKIGEFVRSNSNNETLYIIKEINEDRITVITKCGIIYENMIANIFFLDIQENRKRIIKNLLN